MSKRHEMHVFDNGSASIRSSTHGETMHSKIGPEAEAQGVYLEQTKLAARLCEPSSHALVLYDVGLGIGTNALCAIELAEALGNRRLHVVSFENTLEGIEIALENPDRFPLQARNKAKLEALVKNGVWTSKQVRWDWRLGDFLEQPCSPVPHVVFYDFYSPKSSPDLWGLRAFSKLADCGGAMVLSTYSAATAVRSALIISGFHVGYGKPTALKTETTIASLNQYEIERPLGQPWLDKLASSSASLPADLPARDRQEALLKIRNLIVGTRSSRVQLERADHVF